MAWNYTSVGKKSSGYEDVLEFFKTYNKKIYVSLNDEQRKDIQEDVLEIYRSKNIYPITYYNDQGISDEIKKCVDRDVDFDKILDLKYNQGQSLCRFLFPNLHKVDAGTAKNNSMWDRFYDDHKLKRAIDFALRFKKSVTPSEIRTALELIGGNVGTNFKAMNAKALYEKYVPENGIIYDFSAGFGGRMLGALTSKNNYKYFGVEPCEETFENLNILGRHIERTLGRKNIFQIYKCGSEDFRLKKGEYIDFAFSSPPYFNLEKYSEEETQCYNKFPTLEEWFSGYVKATIENIYYMLKKDCYYAVNIADFNYGNKQVKYVDRWIELSEEVGFTYVEQIPMKLTTRVGSGHSGDKKEGIFVFRK
jgi:hypothetical protein